MDYGYIDPRHSTSDGKKDDESFPDECQNRGCEKTPVRLVKYRNPMEAVPFCMDHATKEVRRDDAEVRGVEAL